jgi:hypothetical protein
MNPIKHPPNQGANKWDLKIPRDTSDDLPLKFPSIDDKTGILQVPRLV